MKTGTLTEAKIDRLWSQALENVRRLDNCRRHCFDFERLPHLDEWTPTKTAACSNCGGTMRLLEINQYVRGAIAYGANPNEIVPGWDGK